MRVKWLTVCQRGCAAADTTGVAAGEPLDLYGDPQQRSCQQARPDQTLCRMLAFAKHKHRQERCDDDAKVAQHHRVGGGQHAHRADHQRVTRADEQRTDQQRLSARMLARPPADALPAQPQRVHDPGAEVGARHIAELRRVTRQLGHRDLVRQ